jgi:cytochrome c-type biogenesis protein CcmH
VSRVQEQEQTINTMIARIEEHLAAEPKDGRGWEIIAPVYLRIGRFADAVKARRNALAFNGETAERQAALGEALFSAANNVVTPEAKAAFERALALDAKNVRARFFMAALAEQEGRIAEAVAILRAMLADAPADAPWIQPIRSELVRLEADVAPPGVANLAPEQVAMVRGMVDRLSERLHRDGSDFEGWLQLVRSYMVLGERDKARATVDEARRAVASDPDKLRRIEEFAKGLGLEG